MLNPFERSEVTVETPMVTEVPALLVVTARNEGSLQRGVKMQMTVTATSHAYSLLEAQKSEKTVTVFWSEKVEEELANVPFSVHIPEKKIPLEDVYIGELPEAIKQLRNMMLHPKQFQAVGAKLPKGMLFTGPPGIGKSCLAEVEFPNFRIHIPAGTL